MRWIQVKNDGIENQKLTLDDVVMLSQKGDTLIWSDFDRYQGREVGSGLYIMRYEIGELFDVLVGGVLDETPWYIYLRVNNGADDRIDIRTEDVSTFVGAHGNDAPKVIEPKPDGGGKPAPEEPDFFTLSEEQTAIHQAILEHNRSADPTGFASCASFAELACVVVDGSDFAHLVEDGMDSQKFILQQTQECYA